MCSRAHSRRRSEAQSAPSISYGRSRRQLRRARKAKWSGLIGRNGAGKTTLLKLLSRITRPTSGFAEIRGRVGSLLEVGTGFHPELTGRENIYLSGAILGMSKREIRPSMTPSSNSPSVERFLDTPLKHYSTGMQMRLAFCRRGAPRTGNSSRG